MLGVHCADSGAGTGIGAVCTEQCVVWGVCSVLPVPGTLNQISPTKF